MNPASNQTIANARHREYENRYGTYATQRTSGRYGPIVIGIAATLTSVLIAAGLFF